MERGHCTREKATSLLCQCQHFRRFLCGRSEKRLVWKERRCSAQWHDVNGCFPMFSAYHKAEKHSTSSPFALVLLRFATRSLRTRLAPPCSLRSDRCCSHSSPLFPSHSTLSSCDHGPALSFQRAAAGAPQQPRSQTADPAHSSTRSDSSSSGGGCSESARRRDGSPGRRSRRCLAPLFGPGHRPEREVAAPRAT